MPKELTSLKELYVHELKDVYSAEKQITRALPMLAKAASSEELKAAFQEHLEQTQEQIKRLDEIFKRLGESSKGPKCKGMEGLLEEGADMSKEEGAPAVIDAGLIVGAQKVEHYEIAAYGSLCTFAELLENDEDLELLKQNLAEEEATDEKLTAIAETVNEEAQGTTEEETEDTTEDETEDDTEEETEDVPTSAKGARR